mgnify:FL=1
MAIYRSYFENYDPNYQCRAAQREIQLDAGVFRPQLRRGGLGGDYLLGGTSGQSASVIDLRGLELAVTLECTEQGAGVISDGIDSIVFQEVEEIILPEGLIDATAPSLQACSDHGVHVRLVEPACADSPRFAAE